MTFVAPESALSPTLRVPSIAVLGADALLAALPATPVQLAHACMLAGYQSVVPASWGDELIAAAALRALPKFGELPAIQCSCPFVAHRLLAAGTDLRPFLVSLVAPPVAVARYLRAAHAPAKLRITFVGRCPGAAEESIDARLTPEELLAMLADRGIALDEQPRVFDSVLPPDRRRYRSQPGGLPTSDMLLAASGTSNGAARTLVELRGDELPLELAQYLLGGKPVLIDVAGKLGCLCSGAAPGGSAATGRAGVTAIEPPRASRPVIDERVPVELELPLPASPRNAIDVVSPPTGAGVRPGLADGPTQGSQLSASNGDAQGSAEERTAASRAYGEADPTYQQAFGARRHPLRGIARPMGGGLPTARDATGRQLPRTYVARRRSPPRGLRVIPPDASGSSGSVSDAVERAAVGATAADAPEANVSGQPTSAAASSARGETKPGSITSPGDATPGAQWEAPATPARAPTTGMGGASVVGGAAMSTVVAGELNEIPLARTSTTTIPIEETDAARYRERAVQLPVMPRSDASKRDATAATASRTGERPLAQLLVFALLISTIVLVSAAVGLVVGRWMAQR